MRLDSITVAIQASVLPGSHNMVEQCCTFLDAAPDHILLVRPELHLGRRAHKLKVRAVIARGNVRVETLIVECGQHVAPGVIRPNPIKERLTDFIAFCMAAAVNS